MAPAIVVRDPDRHALAIALGVAQKHSAGGGCQRRLERTPFSQLDPWKVVRLRRRKPERGARLQGVEEVAKSLRWRRQRVVYRNMYCGALERLARFATVVRRKFGTAGEV